MTEILLKVVLNTTTLNLTQFRHDWYEALQNSPKALNYKLLTENFNYYFKVLDDKNAITLSRFRTLNSKHKLHVEIGRWKNVLRENRICLLCDSVISVMNFFIHVSCHVQLLIKLFLKAKYKNVHPYTKYFKFRDLMNNNNKYSI